MSKHPVIHCAGSLNIDDVFLTSHIVRPGETIPSRTLDRFAGGKGLNQSVALARAGIRVRHVGCIGEDGTFLRDELANEGVNVSDIAVIATSTGHAIIQVADDGENAIVLFGGANHSWTTADIDRLIRGVKIGDILLLQNEINLIPDLMRAAAGAGLKLAMNPAPMETKVSDYPLELLSWLVVNEIEGRQLSGMAMNDRSDKADEAVVRELCDRYPTAVVVMTLGKKGAIRGAGVSFIRSSFADVAPVVDTTGAGDTFMGYWLAAEVSGLDPETALQRACAAGAIAVTRPGAAAGIPFRAEVDGILKSL